MSGSILSAGGHVSNCALLLAGIAAYSMLTHDGRRMVSRFEGTKRRCLPILGNEKYMIRGINILYSEKLYEMVASYAINMI